TDFSRAPGEERFPEYRAANGKADEAGYTGCHGEPLMNVLLILTPAEDNTANGTAAIPSGRGHNLLAVFTGIEPLDFPNVRLYAGVLELFDGLHHQVRTQLQIIGLLVAVEFGKLRLFRRYQELEHEPALTLAMEIFGKTLQVHRLPFVKRMIACRIV